MRVRRTPNPPRRGMVEVLETAIVLPVVMMLTFGTWSTAMGVYYYQLVASLARGGPLRLGPRNPVCGGYGKFGRHASRHLQ